LIPVLNTFQISAEHAALSMNLYERVFRLTARLVNFLAELTRIASRHAVGGQREMSEVSQKLSELGSVVQQYVLILPPTSNADQISSTDYS
jgi:hypothetical protein